MTRPDPATLLIRLKNSATAAHVELLDEDCWRGTGGMHRLRCTAGHVWSRTAGQILFQKPVTCPECRGIQHLARLAALVAQNGSTCLDTNWHGYRSRYRFRCMAGHVWERMASIVFSKNKDSSINNAACPQCRREAVKPARKLNPNGLERLHAAAAAKGGQCLSTTYTGRNADYRFRCAKGHEWEAVGVRVLHGRWCLRCAHDARRKDLKIFQAIAEQRGGQCLSQEYHNNKIKLTWMCHKGHVWQASSSNVRRGSWCPQCAHANKITRADSLARMRYRDASP